MNSIELENEISTYSWICQRTKAYLNPSWLRPICPKLLGSLTRAAVSSNWGIASRGGRLDSAEAAVKGGSTAND
jgi:hypothetical protein